MIPNPNQNDNDSMLLITKFVFCFMYSVFYSAVLRAAQEWLPFSPSFTGSKERWTGWQDWLRWGFAFVFLLFLPVCFLVFVLVQLSKPQPLMVISLDFPTARDLCRLLQLSLLVLPSLGFYDFWQALMRSWPDGFYSSASRKKIE